MDLIRQNKLIGWFIAILIILNLLSLSMLWWQRREQYTPQDRSREGAPPGSIELLQKVIGLSNTQVESFQKMRGEHMQRAKAINDEVDALKLQAVDALFTAKNVEEIDSLVQRIGRLQSQVEVMRFEHFRALVELCTPEQRQKLQPILKEVFGRRPSKAYPKAKLEQDDAHTVQQDRRPPRLEEHKVPPSKEEKIERYTKRLSLTQDQVKKLDDIITSIRTQEENFKSTKKPSPEEFEIEKRRLRKTEDDRVAKILTPVQKKEFETMVEYREKIH